MPGVEVKASVRDGFVVVVLRGDLDVTGAADAQAVIAALVAPGQTLIIDISALDLMDCASLRALLEMQTLARRGGGDVVLAAPQPHVLRLLTLAGRDEVFCVQASVEAGVAGTGAAAGRGTLGGGLRCVLHALGGQPHRIRVPG